MDPNGPSGCEIGINGANKLYFKNYINGSPYYKTMGNYPSDKNIYGICVDEAGRVDLSRLSFGLPAEDPFVYRFANTAVSDAPSYFNFEKTSFVVPAHTISNGATMRIGSGEYLYKGYMDYFLYRTY